MTAQREYPQRRFPGGFRAQRDRGALIVASADGRRQLFFNEAEPLDVPARLEDVTLRAAPAASGERCRFEVGSATWTGTVVARSLQVHERADLYGNVIALPRFDLRRRLLWSILLRVARYRFGQALIRRVTGRSSPPPARADP